MLNVGRLLLPLIPLSLCYLFGASGSPGILRLCSFTSLSIKKYFGWQCWGLNQGSFASCLSMYILQFQMLTASDPELHSKQLLHH